MAEGVGRSRLPAFLDCGSEFELHLFHDRLFCSIRCVRVHPVELLGDLFRAHAPKRRFDFLHSTIRLIQSPDGSAIIQALHMTEADRVEKVGQPILAAAAF